MYISYRLASINTLLKEVNSSASIAFFLVCCWVGGVSFNMFQRVVDKLHFGYNTSLSSHCTLQTKAFEICSQIIAQNIQFNSILRISDKSLCRHKSWRNQGSVFWKKNWWTKGRVWGLNVSCMKCICWIKHYLLSPARNTNLKLLDKRTWTWLHI